MATITLTPTHTALILTRTTMVKFKLVTQTGEENDFGQLSMTWISFGAR